MKSIFVLLMALILSGCAVGNTYQLDNQPLSSFSAGDTSLAVGVLDQRPYVLSKNKAATFIGLQRGGFGNPFDVNTTSGQSLAQDVTSSLLTALNHGKTRARALALGQDDTPEKAKAKLIASGADRALLLIMYEWKSDSAMTLGLNYKLNVEIFDREGRALAKNSVSGHDNLGSTGINPPSYAAQAVPAAYRQKLSELLSGAGVMEALR